MLSFLARTLLASEAYLRILIISPLDSRDRKNQKHDKSGPDCFDPCSQMGEFSVAFCYFASFGVFRIGLV